jgi:hypothetical protein
MTTQPLRRPLQRKDEVEQLLAHYAGDIARIIDAGKAAIKADMNAAGWPARTPEHDRRPSTGQGDPDPSCIDYADPCGELAIRFEQLTGDLEAMQDHEHIIRTSLRALLTIAGRRVGNPAPSIPVCSVTNCTNPIESTGNGGYRGVERIAGEWFIKPGVRPPVCVRHRTVERRAS